ncbi:hypothetical protein PSU4_45460 [Pseudonocardia sulfidoxydans NBRC 16205]|uniref:DUF1275 family protein n=1 Tax=Pseudonocardia sulfidoxydans NBRC 16205 TaxID=1223511 RepID=A0A511DLA1_9PSEU|nr:YoaK family protein [Pseudonocardia sulfidoxydans]GEL25592.1 hypothetical protein PSU4_45460 [Pseudonocardia sulfidoxydans NBRC 16205]
MTAAVERPHLGADMTGNVVFIGFALAGIDGFALLPSVIAVVGFVVGAVGGGTLTQRFGNSRPLLLRNALGIQFTLLAGCLVVSLFVHLRQGGPVATTAVAGVATAAMGLQTATARRIGVPDITTSVVTMTLTGFAADHRRTDAALRRGAVVLSMLIGALCGALLVAHIGSHAGFIAVLVVLGGVGITAALLARHEQPWHA